MKKFKLGIFGITGAVGQELKNVLFERDFPLESLRVFASSRSVDKQVETSLGTLTVENANEANFGEFDICLFAIGGGWPKEYAYKATEQGAYVIDNSSTFRYEDSVPLVIPEINPEAIGESKLISNPNCTTAIAAIPLWVIHKNFGLKKVIISTYQATSGAGAEGMTELEEETKKYLNNEEVGCNVFAHPICFNIIPHIDKFQENDYTKEEMKVVWETRKIFGDSSIPISCTCVRIPTMRAHAESIVVETEKEISPGEVKELFEKTPGLELRDKISENTYPMPLTASKKYDVEVGRVRQNLIFGKNGVEFFVCGDQILKGAALNTVQIAEVIKDKF